MNTSIEPASSKRKRLSHACNNCRQKKTRCDEQQPCRPCEQAGVECITTDKRRDGAPVARRRRTGASVSSQPPTTPSFSSPSNDHIPSVLSAQDRPRLWSQCWGRERWRTGRLPMMPRLSGGSMLELTNEWLNLAFYRMKARRNYSIAPVIDDRFSNSLPRCAPNLPSPTQTRGFIDSYFATIHCLFSFVDRSTVEDIYDCDLTRSEGSSLVSESSNPCRVALIYLTVAGGILVTPASETSQKQIPTYLTYCNTLLGHLVATRALESVQAILLFAIILRCCDRVAWAWDLLTMGVSMAKSMGINQVEEGGFQQTRSSNASDGVAAKTWRTMYVFEKILAFESGRPSMVWDHKLSKGREKQQTTGMKKETEFEFQDALLRLANVLHEMQERSAQAWHREESLPQSVDEAIEEKIRTGGELALLLGNWRENLPLQHNALLVNKDELFEVVDKYATGKPWKQRLLDSPVVVIEAARDLVRLLVELVDLGTPNFLSTLASPLNAVGVLAVHIMRERGSLLIRSEYELMKVATQLTRAFYHKHGAMCNADDFLDNLDQYILSWLEEPMPRLSDQSTISPTAAFNEETIDLAQDHFLPSWGQSSLDWAGWDWNDLSHLFEHSE
ncbi:uncharacterized protein N7506_009306 [Penicillium brevicompactum]|uniref:uncharacterized protein n=1 Tax=Penicillium brevicompactum TaxID=5074 RepID=UPI00253F8B43|nr:uncharacterized protein N7506_009306 [Penicillium brevicompactum]KAJ5326204.1 hypothetical protein N7506_009306 [Penicillium brevicompactum]